mmetsp:Transcript_89380/g.163904  ORF Transcript_89380/g.163904 Transcript_89380/m.163904 type:complete len:367 (+) Transcript_89380:38-1138(+)
MQTLQRVTLFCAFLAALWSLEHLAGLQLVRGALLAVGLPESVATALVRDRDPEKTWLEACLVDEENCLPSGPLPFVAAGALVWGTEHITGLRPLLAAERDKKNNVIRIGFFLVLILNFSWAVVLLSQDPQRVRAGAIALLHQADKWDERAGFLMYLLITFFGVIFLMSTTVMELMGGFLFTHKWGLFQVGAATCVAKLAANMVSVFVARKLLRNFVKRELLSRSVFLKTAAKAAKERPLQTAFLVRGSMAPLAVKNYGLGITDVPYRHIAGCSLIFTPFYAFQNLYLGNTARDFAALLQSETPAGSNTPWGVQGLVFNVVLVVAGLRIVRAQVRARTAEAEQEMVTTFERQTTPEEYVLEKPAKND